MAVTLRLDVGADSSTPPGGAVWFSVLLRNDADLPVRIDDLTAKGAGLELSVAEPSQGRRPAVPRTLDPGGQARVLMSVRLFCADRRAARSQPGGTVVTGALQVTPADGRRREIIDVLSGSGPVTDAADTVCRYQDRATGVELSGPVLRR